MTRLLLVVAVACLSLLTLAPAPVAAGNCGYAASYRAGYQYWAGGYYQGSYYVQGYYAPTYAVPVYPTYSVSHNPDSRKQLEIIDRAMQILEKLAVANIQPSGNGGEPRPAKLVSGLDVLRVRCANCHQSNTVEEKGSKLVILDSKAELAPLSLAEKKRIVERAYHTDPKKVMPPGKPLAAEERAKIADVLGIMVVEAGN